MKLEAVQVGATQLCTQALRRPEGGGAGAPRVCAPRACTAPLLRLPNTLHAAAAPTPLQRDLHQTILQLCEPQGRTMAAALAAAAHGTSPGPATPPALPNGEPAQLIEQTEREFADALRQVGRGCSASATNCAASRGGDADAAPSCCALQRSAGQLQPVQLATSEQPFPSVAPCNPCAAGGGGWKPRGAGGCRAAHAATPPPCHPGQHTGRLCAAVRRAAGADSPPAEHTPAAGAAGAAAPAAGPAAGGTRAG